jgi:hypothetical protein|tara:strand:+ start:616 stop:762 length:147 start_codon:yes stop_codon:yes gene_type:complete
MSKIVVTIEFDTDTYADIWAVDSAAVGVVEKMMSLAAFQSMVTSEVIE